MHARETNTLTTGFTVEVWTLWQVLLKIIYLKDEWKNIVCPASYPLIK